MPLEVKIVLPPFLDVHLHNDQLVMQVVEIVLHFAVGQFAVDEVAEIVVVIGRSVGGFQAVVLNGRGKSYLIKFIFKSHKKTSFICIQ